MDKFVQAQAALFEKIAAYRPVVGPAAPPNAALRNAYFKTPRHKFMGQFRKLGEPTRILTPEASGAIDAIYSNEPLLYVRSHNAISESSSSEPAFILHLVSLLMISEGERILEVGSGTGWLLGILRNMTGSSGRVTGIEVDKELAAESVSNLASIGIHDVTVIGADAATACVTQRFDVVVFTASSYYWPEWLDNCVEIGGRVLIPLRNRGLGEEVFILRRESSGWRSECTRLCKFVRLVGVDAQGSDPSGAPPLERNDNIEQVLSREVDRETFIFGRTDGPQQLRLALPFSSYLSKTEPMFSAHTLHGTQNMYGIERVVFGDYMTLGFVLRGPEESSLVLWHRGMLVTFGDVGARHIFKERYEQWIGLGEPSGASFDLEVHDGVGTDGEDLSWIERRGRKVFWWTLRNELGRRPRITK